MPLILDDPIVHTTTATSLRLTSIIEDVDDGYLRFTYTEMDADDKALDKPKVYEVPEDAYTVYIDDTAGIKNHWLQAIAAHCDLEHTEIKQFVIGINETVCVVITENSLHHITSDEFQNAIGVASNASGINVYDTMKAAVYGALPNKGSIV